MSLAGDDPPDLQGRSNPQFPSNPAIDNIMGRARGFGPELPLVIQALEA
jgi:hypothetical protein